MQSYQPNPSQHTPPTFLPKRHRVVVIGDVHGDLALLIGMLKLAKIIDSTGQWIGKDAAVVQLGDQIDDSRIGHDEPNHNTKTQSNSKFKPKHDIFQDTMIIDYMDQLATRALQHQGLVINLIGNHELMNVCGNYSYVSFLSYYHYKYHDIVTRKVYVGNDGRAKSFQRGVGPLALNLANHRQAVVVIGKSLFVHAGFLADTVHVLEEANQLNRASATQVQAQTQASTSQASARHHLEIFNDLVRLWLLKKLDNTIADDYVTEFIRSANSPFWTRIFGNIPTNTRLGVGDCKDYVKPVLDLLDIDRIFCGHTPQANGINGTCTDDDGMPTLYRVDGGFAECFSDLDVTNRTSQSNQSKGSKPKKRKRPQLFEIIDDAVVNLIE